ncbi:abortive infection family protein [Bradyrhizobium sp. RDT10]
MEHLEGRNRVPGDAVVSDALQSFDADGVHAVWSKALNRRAQDPEGAITVARTLLETVCKRILDDIPVTYSDKEDLPKLYTMAAKALKLAPDQHTEEPIKAILGGAMTLVNGLGTLRNRLSDSHGRGESPSSPRRGTQASPLTQPVLSRHSWSKRTSKENRSADSN